MRISSQELEHLRTLRVWIAGAGKSGLGSAFICKKHGIEAFLSDSGKLSDEAKAKLTEASIRFEDGGHSLEKFDAECDLLVLSPTILLSQGLAIRARQRKIPIVSEIELASWFLPKTAYVCGITGTNGKSTTTHYLGQLFSRMGLKGVACGNIGNPISVVSHDEDNTPNLALALELSSYQLETTYSLEPQAGMLLNLQVDHQERYRNLDEYLKAKWRLLMMLPPHAIAVVDAPALTHALRLGLALPRCEVVVLRKGFEPPQTSALARIWRPAASLPLALYGDLRQLDENDLVAPASLGKACYRTSPTGVEISISFAATGRTFAFTVTEPCLPGEHNVQNLLAASVVALHAGAALDTVKAQWEISTTRYEHLAHRLEDVGGRLARFRDSQGRLKTLRIINDSKATNVESVLVALRSFAKPVRLLLGGHSKGESYEPLAAHADAPVVAFYPFGAAGGEVHSELVPRVGASAVRAPLPTLLAAAQAALDEAGDGEIVLLSPACASFDEFRNFEERGNRFREWALARCEGKA